MQVPVCRAAVDCNGNCLRSRSSERRNWSHQSLLSPSVTRKVSNMPLTKQYRKVLRKDEKTLLTGRNSGSDYSEHGVFRQSQRSRCMRRPPQPSGLWVHTQDQGTQSLCNEGAEMCGSSRTERAQGKSKKVARTKSLLNVLLTLENHRSNPPCPTRT